MPNVVGTLIEQAVRKRAQIFEEWILCHENHSIESIRHSDDLTTLTGKCACSATIEVTITLGMSVRTTPQLVNVNGVS